MITLDQLDEAIALIKGMRPIDRIIAPYQSAAWLSEKHRVGTLTDWCNFRIGRGLDPFPAGRWWAA